MQAALTDRVMSFFEPMKGDPTRLICPELAAQMERLLAAREKQLQGTLNSHKARREQGKEGIGTYGGSHVGTHGGSGVASELNRTELNRTALRKGADKSQDFKTKSNGGAPDADFIAGYEAEQAKENAGGAPASTRA
jgi:hypothetical protein